MKTIVISGARSNVGKTTLAEKISGLLPGSVCVKLGHGAEKKDAGNVFYRAGKPFTEIVEENRGAEFLVIESNRVLEEVEPDLAVFLPADDPKPSAAAAESKADLVRGKCGGKEAAGLVACRLGIDMETAGRIADAACETGDIQDGHDEQKR